MKEEFRIYFREGKAICLRIAYDFEPLLRPKYPGEASILAYPTAEKAIKYIINKRECHIQNHK